jgi:folate-binding protein YgfZ
MRRHIWRMTQPCFVAELDSRSLIRISGADWRSFLQGLITQDVESLAAAEIRFAALLNPQGKLLYDLFIVGQADGCLLDAAAAHRDALMHKLTLYRLRAKVSLEPVDGPVLALWPAPQTPLGPGWGPDPRLSALGLRGYGAEPPAGAEAVDEAAYHRHRLALGAPDAAADAPPESAYPIEANFDLLGGVDFKKGCFVGQETTSRMKRRGTIKSRMLPLVFDGPPPAFGAEVLAGELRAGEVRAGMDGRAMALLRLDRIEDAALTVDGRPVKVERPDYFEA